MDKRKIANKQVKDKLLSALVSLLQQKEWSQITITELIGSAGVARASYYRNFAAMEALLEYGLAQIAQRFHDGSPLPVEDFHSLLVMEYKFRFYRENAALILAFHHAKTPMTLLGVITDCMIEQQGDMPTSAISKYELYYYSGAFYNMVLSWLEGGAAETPEDMAAEFLRLSNNPSSVSKAQGSM